MNQFKFTPAPWLFLFGYTPESVVELEVSPEHSHDGSRWKFKEIKVGDQHGRVIATVSARTTKDGVTNEEFEANAKLFVCGPEMIQELKASYECLLELYSSSTIQDNAPEWIFESLRTRMAKQLEIIDKVIK